MLVICVIALSACGTSESEPISEESTPTLEATPTLVPTTEPTATPTTSAEGTRRATDGDFVTVHYVGALDSGEVFSTTRGREPITFTLGSRQMITGFDEAIHGMSVGETITVRIEPEKAYGQYREDMILDLPVIPEAEGLVPGDQVQLANGLIAVVLEITDEIVRVDANHELAGEALIFDIELISIE